MSGDQEPHTNGVNGDASDDEVRLILIDSLLIIINCILCQVFNSLWYVFIVQDDQKNMRPVDIEADVNEMERRKRVETIMNSKLFREELERVVGDSIRDSGADSIAGLISDVMNIKTGSKLNKIINSSW